MHIFKKGDSVQGPGGCVGMFIEYGNYHKTLVDVGDENLNYLTTWETKDCQPAPDYAPLVEAANKAYKEIKSYVYNGGGEICIDEAERLLESALADLTHAPSVETIKGRSDDEDYAKQTVDAGLYEAVDKASGIRIEMAKKYKRCGHSVSDILDIEKVLADAIANSKPAEPFQDFWDRVIDKTDSDTRISNVTMNYMYKHCMDAWYKPKECGDWCEHYVVSDLTSPSVPDWSATWPICKRCMQAFPTYGMPGCPHGGGDE